MYKQVFTTYCSDLPEGREKSECWVPFTRNGGAGLFKVKWGSMSAKYNEAESTATVDIDVINHFT